MLQVPVSDAFSFHKPQQDLKACQEEPNWIGKTLSQSEAKDGSEDATPSTHCTSSSFGSLKSPPTWMDRSRYYCGTVARLMAILTVMLFAAFYIYLHFGDSKHGASVGARVKFSFTRCWPVAPELEIYNRCPFQIALALEGVGALGGIGFDQIIAKPVVENMTVNLSGKWQGEYFVGIEFRGVDHALAFEKFFLAVSEEVLLKQAEKNFLSVGYVSSGFDGIDVRRACTSSDTVEERRGVEGHYEGDYRVKVPRCMYDL